MSSLSTRTLDTARVSQLAIMRMEAPSSCRLYPLTVELFKQNGCFLGVDRKREFGVFYKTQRLLAVIKQLSVASDCLGKN